MWSGLYKIKLCKFCAMYIEMLEAANMAFCAAALHVWNRVKPAIEEGLDRETGTGRCSIRMLCLKFSGRFDTMWESCACCICACFNVYRIWCKSVNVFMMAKCTRIYAGFNFEIAIVRSAELSGCLSLQDCKAASKSVAGLKWSSLTKRLVLRLQSALLSRSWSKRARGTDNGKSVAMWLCCMSSLMTLNVWTISTNLWARSSDLHVSVLATDGQTPASNISLIGIRIGQSID